MEEQQSFVDFEDATRDFYESLTSVDDVLNFWEQIAYIGNSGEVDGRTIREYISHRGPMKAVMGLYFIIAFDNDPNGTLVVYHIQRSSFLRSR